VTGSTSGVGGSRDLDFFPIRVACPRCQSLDVTYTCEPKCCFNHLCGSCYGTFELKTTLRADAGPFKAPAFEHDVFRATVDCARCRGVNVFLAGSGEPGNAEAACADCGALLTLEIETT